MDKLGHYHDIFERGGAEGKQLIFKRIIHNCGLVEWGEMKSFYIKDKKRNERNDIKNLQVETTGHSVTMYSLGCV